MSQDPRHPKSSFGGKYPMNRVTVTESGHEFHFDDTPGKERIRLAHMSGSYTEMSRDGRRVDMTVGHQISYAKGGLTQSVDKNMDVKVGGSTRTNVDGDTHSEVRGTSSSAVAGDSLSMIGGDSVSATQGDVVSAVTGKVSLKAGGLGEMKLDGSGTLKVTGPIVIESGGSITLKVGGSTIVMDAGGIQLKASRIDLN